MTKQNAIETVTSYFEEIDTRALVLDLKTTKDAEADYEASKYLFGDQDPESEPLENHEDLLEENEKLLIEYYKKQPEEFFAEWNEGNLLLIMARDLKSITIKITKSGLNITEILERTKRIYGNVRDRYFDGDRTEDIVWFLNFITSGEPTKGNPINKGTAVMGKYHFDFDSKRTIKNPKEKIYIHEDKVPRTVSDELWNAANEQIDKRSVKTKDGEDDIGKNPGKYQLSGKIVCGMCGQPYWRKVHRKHSNHELIYTWACSSYLELGRSDNLRARPNLRKVFLENEKGCDNINIAENEFYAVLEEICSNQYQKNKKKIIEKMMKLLSKSLNNQDGTKEIEKLEREQEDIERKMKFLVDKLIDGVLTDQMYKTKQEELEKKRDQNKKKILELTERTSNTQNIKDRLQEIETRLNDDDLFKKATIDDMLEEVDKIVVYPRYMEIYFSLSSVTGCMDLKIFDGDKKCFRVDYGNRLDYKSRQCDAREVVVDLIRENPRITGKMIAKEIGCSLSGANYKLKVLKKEGRIRFNGAGGKGCWEILE